MHCDTAFPQATRIRTVDGGNSARTGSLSPLAVRLLLTGRFLEHQSVKWDLFTGTGFGEYPGISVGVGFQLNDADKRDVSLDVTIRIRGEVFEVSGDVMVDEPLPGVEQGGNQRFIRELPEVRTTDLGECIATLKSHTAALCSYTSVLEELGVPRTPAAPDRSPSLLLPDSSPAWQELG